MITCNDETVVRTLHRYLRVKIGHADRAMGPLTLQVPVTKIAEFANSLDLDEVAHDEPPHLHLHCLPSSLCILNMIQRGLNFFFLKICRRKYVVCFLVIKELR